MDTIKISFCLPVYNQIDMIRKAIHRIIEYPGNDIEIIVCDDCSTENIIELINSFNDPRIFYFRNTVNLGHDLNILQCFRHARSSYAFLLRVRDYIIPSAIKSIIKRIDNTPGLAYLTGNALDEFGKPRLLYNIEHYAPGKEAIEAHKKLYFHPSGSLYRINFLNLDRIEKFIVDNVDKKYGFIIHYIIRLELSTKGSFEIICDEPIWQYTITTNSTDVAVNSTKNKVSVFAPQYVEQRYLNELNWVNMILEPKYKLDMYQWLFIKYLDLVTWGFKRRNEEPKLQKHYNCEKMPFNIVNERHHFTEITKNIIEQLILDNDDKNSFYRTFKKYSFLNKTYYLFRFYFAKCIRKTFLYRIHLNNNVHKGRT